MSFKKRRFAPEIGGEGDKFETEGLAFLNEKSDAADDKVDDDSDVDLIVRSDSDDDAQLVDGGGSEDEGPESVGFHSSKQSALQQLRTAMTQIDSLNERKKKQRQKLDERFKEQKAKKLEELSKARLPDSILEGLDDEIPKKKKKLEKKTKTRKPKPEDDLEAEFDDVLLPAGDFSDEYLPLSTKTDSASGVEVVPLAWADKKVVTLTEAAADFRQNRLYGPNIPRESNKTRMLKAEKRRARFR